MFCPQEKCHQYWPAERSARYQYFVVDPMAEYNMPQYILREFKVTDARVSVSQRICTQMCPSSYPGTRGSICPKTLQGSESWASCLRYLLECP